MQIQSQFRDYYDHVAHQFGGGDPKCVYRRTRIAERKFIDGTSYAGILELTQKDIVKLPYTDHQLLKINFKWLVVCGKYFLIVADKPAFLNPVWDIYTPEKYTNLAEILGHRWSGYSRIINSIGKFSEPLLELSRKVHAPVFTFSNNYRNDLIIVDGEIPILGNIGFASIVDSQQIYQELSYFLGNIIKTSPDLAPVSTMTDKEKINQHGFDLKQSFRHRV